jgi:hypothetical protein
MPTATWTDSAGALSLLNSLNLRNADGSDADFADYDEFAAWLQEADATNMANMLSAQLAATALNEFFDLVDGDALVFAPDCGNTGVDNNFITINRFDRRRRCSAGR